MTDSGASRLRVSADFLVAAAMADATRADAPALLPPRREAEQPSNARARTPVGSSCSQQGACSLLRIGTAGWKHQYQAGFAC